MSALDYLSAGGWMRLSSRRDGTLMRWLHDNQDAEAAEAAEALGWSVHGTHRRLLRLEREGRVHALTVSDDIFNYTVYRSFPQRNA